jgi:hypothetical protein
MGLMKLKEGDRIRIKDVSTVDPPYRGKKAVIDDIHRGNKYTVRVPELNGGYKYYWVDEKEFDKIHFWNRVYDIPGDLYVTVVYALAIYVFGIITGWFMR